MKPAYKLTVSGTDITGLVQDRLLMLTITDEAGVKSDRLELVLDDRDQRLAIPPRKAVITAAIGYRDKLVSKGQFTVEEVELAGPDRTMTIRANATGATKGAGAAKQRSWDDTTLGGIARSIAKKHGWTAAISPDLDKIEIPHIDQNENDLQFLVRLAADNSAVAKVAHNKLVIAPHAEGKTVSGKAMPTVTVSADRVSDWSMTLAERGGYTGVKASYHDVKAGERGEAIAGEDGENATTLPHTYATKAAAERAAKSRKASLERGKATFEFSMPGDPTLEAEISVNATGFRTGVDGKWTVLRVAHRLTPEGYSSAVSCETPGSSKTSSNE